MTLNAFLSDLRWAIRSLSTSWRFMTVAMATLAMGVGVSTAMFTLVYAATWRPLPYPDPDRIVSVWLEEASGGWSGASYGLAAALVSAGVLESVTPTVYDDFLLLGRGEPEVIRGISVAPDFFRVVVPPVLGRGFSDDERGAIVITHGFWLRRFGGDPAVLGREVALDPERLTVIGVMPPAFRFLDRVEFLKPLPIDAGDRAQHGTGPFEIFGRIAGASLEEAQARADVVVEQLRREYPDEYSGRRVRLMTYRRFLAFEWDEIFELLSGAVAFVLLIACTNASTLLMVHAASRQRDLAVRAILGASCSRLIRQQLLEGLLLAVPAAIAGVAIAHWIVVGFLVLVPEGFPRVDEVRIDPMVLATALAVSIAAALAASAWPAIAARQVQVSRLHFLIALEAAMTVVLAAGAIMLLSSLHRLTTVDTGVRNVRFVVATFDADSRLPDERRRAALMDSIVENIRSLPLVRNATVASRRPVQIGRAATVRVEGTSAASSREVSMRFRSVGPDYFQLLGIPMLRGRTFERQDRIGGQAVAIVNQSAAKLLGDGVDPVGKRMSVAIAANPVDLVIVGVVADVRAHLSLPPGPEFFVPLAQVPPIRATVMVFTEVSAAAIGPLIKAAVWRADPTLPVSEVQDFEAVLYRQSDWMRFRSVMVSAFAAFGIVLAIVGVWAVAAFSVVQRTREIGIRTALGALPWQVMGSIVRQVVPALAIGAAAGVTGAFNLSQFLQQWLFEVEATDPVLLAAAAIVLIVLGLSAAVIPARRAARIDPALTLRAE